MSTTTTAPNTPTSPPFNKKRGWKLWFARLLALKFTKVPRVHPTLRVPRLPGGFVQLIKPGIKYEKIASFSLQYDRFQCVDRHIILIWETFIAVLTLFLCGLSNKIPKLTRISLFFLGSLVSKGKRVP
ncbi:hypothetical protein SK128_021451 [Halocaridina rubra]|uniref:Uncharacterized protein n=1 Tax=Halocaridina rubra TaxID=373956 RepID=A0AAN8WFA9_HALRR